MYVHVTNRFRKSSIFSVFCKKTFVTTSQSSSYEHQYLANKCNINDFKQLLEVENDKMHTNDYPYANEIKSGVVIYDNNNIPYDNQNERKQIQAEMCKAFIQGSGIVVIKNSIETDIVDNVTKTFLNILENEKLNGKNQKDHFGKEGANGRIWNALEKLAVEDPHGFTKYYSSNAIHLVSNAYLGPSYQMTSQINLVYPGGEAQQAHRDYHLGFQGNDVIEQFPSHVHQLCSQLTLQGAVAHCDMPLISGPTEYLPHSHKYKYGYLAYRIDEFQTYFKNNFIQLPLNKGDSIFFNPAVFHAAGSNTSNDINRMANLLQVSSAFGRPMETVDRLNMISNIYPTLLKIVVAGSEEEENGWTKEKTKNVIASVADGYSFPTNLDTDPPIETTGLAPEPQAELMWKCIQNNCKWEEDAKEIFQSHWKKKRSGLDVDDGSKNNV